MYVPAAAPRLSARARPTQAAVPEMATVSHMLTHWQMKGSSRLRARRSATPSPPHESSTNAKKKIRRTTVQFPAVEVTKVAGELSKSLRLEFMNQQAQLEKET
jgi:hypothetical protein